MSDDTEDKGKPRVLREAARVSITSAKTWKVENRAAIQAANEYVDKHGLPLARYRGSMPT